MLLPVRGKIPAEGGKESFRKADTQVVGDENDVLGPSGNLSTETSHESIQLALVYRFICTFAPRVSAGPHENDIYVVYVEGYTGRPFQGYLRCYSMEIMTPRQGYAEESNDPSGPGLDLVKAACAVTLWLSRV